LWVLSVERALFRHSSAQNFEIAPTFFKNM